MHELKFYVCSTSVCFLCCTQKYSSLDEIGTVVLHVTVLFTATYEKHATNSFEIIKAIIDENENPETMCGTEVL